MCRLDHNASSMFVGHLALGFAAKRATPRVSLAVLLTASQLADVLWPLFLALGLEQVRIDPGNTAFTPLDFVSYPYSHSLVRSEEHTSELQSHSDLVCRLL